MNIKQILSSIIIIYIPTILLAQKHSENDEYRKVILNLGIENQLPLNPFKTFYNYGVGATISAELKLFKNFNVALEPGYTNYSYNLKSLGVSGNTGYFSVLAGPKYSLPYNLYLTAKAGLGVKLLKEEKESGLALSGGIGIYFTKKLDAQLKYLKINTATTAPRAVCFRIGYNFL